MESTRRVLVIGLDGATFDVILPWTEQGKLPNFARILAGGAWGPLKSTVPPMTFPAWTSLMTGKNPGKHGIFDFTEREPGGYGIRFVNASWVKSKTIWRILSDAGRRVAVLSLPVTYPPEPVNGVMVSGFDTPGLTRGRADARAMHPPSLHQELLENVGGYVVSANALALADDPERALRALLGAIDQKIRCARYVYRKEPWDAFMMVLGETDMTGHLFWNYHDPRSPLSGRPPSEACRDALLTVYQRADAFIGELMDEGGKATTTILVSDHGFGGSSDTGVFLNRWLEQHGFLHFAAASGRTGLHALRARANDVVAAWLGRAKRVGVNVVPSALKAWLFRMRPALVNRMESYLRFGAIDWGRTAAFADENPYYPQIWLNVKGREPHGTVGPGDEYERVRDAIIERLYTWKDPETGAAIVKDVFKRDAVYAGPYVDKSPDLLIEWHLKGDYSYVPRRSQSHDCAEPVRRLSPAETATLKSGSHRDLGILALVGEDIRANTAIRDASILDVAPTILHLLGVPVPEDMDGRVLEQAMREELLETNPVAYAPREQGAASNRAEEGYSTDEAAVIEERLKSLGYIE